MTTGLWLSINRSINLICNKQPKPIVAKPNICKKRKNNTTTLHNYYHTDRGKKRETKLLLIVSSQSVDSICLLFYYKNRTRSTWQTDIKSHENHVRNDNTPSQTIMILNSRFANATCIQLVERLKWVSTIFFIWPENTISILHLYRWLQNNTFLPIGYKNCYDHTLCNSQK